MTTKDYLYSNNIDTDLLVVIGGLIVILFLMMLIMYFINSLRHKEITGILEKISFPEKSGSNSLKPEAVSCNLLSLCVLAPVFCTPRKLAEVSGRSSWRVRRKLHGRRGAVVLMVPGGEYHRAISSQSPADKYDLINKTSRVSPDSGSFYEPDTVLDHRERVRLFIQIQFPHGSDWSEVLRLTDIVTEKVSSGRTAGGYHHRHTGYTWSVSVN